MTYTVPVGRTAVVRSITLSSNATVAGEVKIYVGAASTPTLIWVGQVPPKTTVILDHWMALLPGDTLRGKVVTGQQNVTMAVFGALLLGEPE